jgi:hypothetical protein
MAGAFISSSRVRMPESSFPSQKKYLSKESHIGKTEFRFSKAAEGNSKEKKEWGKKAA